MRGYRIVREIYDIDLQRAVEALMKMRVITGAGARRFLIRTLLAILNSRWLNGTPCRYGFINNIEAFDFDNLHFEIKARPGLTVFELLRDARMWQNCPLHPGVSVIEGDRYREATDRELQELKDLRP